ncbi:MAG: xanthine dehydrogenase family protein molybdopterin-binding subunit, partial [Chromatiales bacterium]|nr:xanthine dehydrogenase family protein molybdopterin-binding subunit [Chromatiales bacterium]
EELDADWASVQVEPAPIEPVYANVTILTDSLGAPDAKAPLSELVFQSVARAGAERIGAFVALQVTGGSTSVRDAWLPMRQAGAMARAMLVQAAASRWRLSRSLVTVEAGVLQFQPDNLEIGFGTIAAAASLLPPPSRVELKPKRSWRLIGSSPLRLDVPAKIDGSAQFGMDIRLDGMLYGAVRLKPVVQTSGTFETTDAQSMSGVHAIVGIEEGIVVLADNTWVARQAAAAVRWVASSGAAGPSTNELTGQLREAAKHADMRIYEERGEATDRDGRSVDAVYEVPFLAHACMEPANCTAKVTRDRCELWLPTQAPSLCAYAAAAALRLAPSQVTVHQTYLGGGFGRRTEVDAVRVAVQVAQTTDGRPVQVVWSREEDMTHDMYRPAGVARMRAQLDATGSPIVLEARVASASVVGSFGVRMGGGGNPLPGQADPGAVEGIAFRHYAIDRVMVQHQSIDAGVPVGFWRSVGFSSNSFYSESFIDELAFAAGVDPLAYRRRLLRGRPRQLAVLERVARLSEWSAALTPGRGRGVALVECFGSIVAQVVEVSVSANHRFTVEKISCVIDCGEVVYPDQVEAQMQSGIVYGLSAALWGRIDFIDGAVSQTNFHDYPVLRISEMPRIEVEVLAGRGAPGGVGEPGTPPVAPALANALFAASAERVRTLPITASRWQLG